MNNKENFKKKILYRSSHRGTKEMDILLSTFVNKYIDTFNIHDLEELNKILADFYRTKKNYTVAISLYSELIETKPNDLWASMK